MRQRLAVLVLAVLALPACGYTPPALGDWRDDPLCGRYENRNRDPSEQQRQATQCLLDAFAEGRPAQLVATHHTAEGDPIVEYYRVLARDAVEVFVDTTDDAYGKRGWAHMLCAGIAAVPGLEQVTGQDCRQLSVDEVVTEAG